MIPAELQELRQWTYSISPEEPKRPAHTDYTPGKGLTYTEAIEYLKPGVSFGLYVTDQDPYILGDIDHIENVHEPFIELPSELMQLLSNFPTYAEVSPSGKGIRFIYKLPSVKEKSRVSNKYFLSKEINRGAQINVGPPWMRFTGQSCQFSNGSGIATVTWADLEPAFKIHFAEVRNVTTPEISSATLAEVEDHLMRIPLDQNPRVRRAFSQLFEVEYHHYTFWMKVLMALHCYGEATNQIVECMSLAIRWSSRDPLSYQGDGDVINHWRSLSNGKCDIISHRTLFALANKCTFIWPMPRPTKKDESKWALRKPINTEIANLLYFLEFYDLRIYSDSGNPNILYVTGDEDVLVRYVEPFQPEKLFGKYYGPMDLEHLISALIPWCQRVGFSGLGRKMLKDHLLVALHASKNILDPVKYYFETPFDELLPEYRENETNYNRSTFEDLYDCLEIDYMTGAKEKEDELYQKYYKSWLCGLIRSMYYMDHPIINNCILLLTGAEQIRKTSHFRYLLPQWMRKRYIAFTTHGFATETSMRDLVKISASARIVVWDELEQFLKVDTEPNFKKVIDNTPQTVIDKYEVIPRTIYPISIYGATSNLREFKLGSEGSRRLFHIPVKWVDTDRMDRICWHKLINDLTQEVRQEITKGNVPWLLNQEQLQYQMSLHSLIRSKSNVDIMLEETFNFDGKAQIKHGVLPGVSSFQSDMSGQLLSTKQVHDLLCRFHSQAYTISRPALNHALRRLCSEYTGTEKTEQPMITPSGRVWKGVFYQGPHKRWVMPPLRDSTTGAFTGIS